MVSKRSRRTGRVTTVLLAAYLVSIDAFKLTQGTISASPSHVGCAGRHRGVACTGIAGHLRRSVATSAAVCRVQTEISGGWREIWLDDSVSGSKSAGGARGLAENIQRGSLVLELAGVASNAECQLLVNAATQRAEPGTVRIPSIAAVNRKARQMGETEMDHDALPAAADDQAEVIFQRVLAKIDEHLPSLVTTLFNTDAEITEESARSLSARHAAGALRFTNMEPAINVYTNNGQFPAHRDRMALTMLLSLSPPTSFAGGGTGFWCSDSADGEPASVRRPIPGTVLLWGGEMVHAGMPVESGTRCVYVASFTALRHHCLAYPQIHEVKEQS